VDRRRRVPYNDPRKCHGEGVFIVALQAVPRAGCGQPTPSRSRARASVTEPQTTTGRDGSRSQEGRRANPFDVLPRNFRSYDLLWSVYQSSRR
jgi:hypothetical protein